MAFKRGGHKRPQYSVSTSVAIRKGKYLKGPSFGLWLNDSDVPMARGSVKENYLSELVEFLTKAERKDLSVSFALFKNKDKKRRDKDDDDDEEEEEEEEEDEDKKSAKKTGKKAGPSKKDSGKKSDKKSGKKSDWDFDDDDE